MAGPYMLNHPIAEYDYVLFAALIGAAAAFLGALLSTFFG